MKTILVAEDNFSTKEFITNSLVKGGYKVLNGQNSGEALELFRKQKVDMVLTGANMANLDGINLIRELRSVQNHSATPIVVFNINTKATKQRVSNAGATTCIDKKLTGDILIFTAKVLIK